MEKRNVCTFVGILLVGLLMFGLVSGAGYNIVVPVANPPATGGSGGGGTTTITPAANVTTTDNETVSDGETVVVEEKDAKEDVSGDSITSDIKDEIGGAVSYVKQFWIEISVVALVLVISVAVYFKRKKK